MGPQRSWNNIFFQSTTQSFDCYVLLFRFSNGYNLKETCVIRLLHSISILGLSPLLCVTLSWSRALWKETWCAAGPVIVRLPGNRPETPGSPCTRHIKASRIKTSYFHPLWTQGAMWNVLTALGFITFNELLAVWERRSESMFAR